MLVTSSDDKRSDNGKKTVQTAVGSSAGPNPTADRIGRGISVFNVLATLVALGNGILTTVAAPPETLVVETWRTVGFVVFAGLWALLVRWPRSLPGVWEPILVHEVVVTVLYSSYGAVPDAPQAALIDLVVTVTTVASSVLCRGWPAWRGVAPSPVGSGVAARA